MSTFLKLATVLSLFFLAVTQYACTTFESSLDSTSESKSTLEGPGDGQSSAAALVSQAVVNRQQLLQSLNNWEFDGRISLVTEDEAWTGKLNWYQQDENFLIFFHAPSGQGALQLRGNAAGVELQLANGDVYAAQDASVLLKRETNWELPIDSLWYWIRGLPNPESSYEIAKLNKDGLIEEIDQDNWQIQYARYQHFQNYQFPKKIVIKHEDLKLRLIVTQWTVS